MNQMKVSVIAALALFASTSAMALRTPESYGRGSQPAGTTIDVNGRRDAVLDARHGDEEWRQSSKQQDKRARKQAKKLRKQEQERQKEMREARREREKDLREAAREREKDLREAQRERAKRDRDDDLD